MKDETLTCDPPDICLMLRADAEQQWLALAVLPLVRELERETSLAERDLGAAIAYLEVLWLDACQRAVESDGARATLDRDAAQRDPLLCDKARRYHAAVRRMRAAVRPRVAALTGLCEQPQEAREHAG
jgi:hypothetical protein